MLYDILIQEHDAVHNLAISEHDSLIKMPSPDNFQMVIWTTSQQ